jgi:predicted nucleic acid-binding protein
LLEPLRILALDEQSAKIAASLHADLISTNQDIGVKDVLIASICLRHEMTLLTANIRHFSRISNLRCIASAQF